MTRNTLAFTLVETIVALVVSSVVMVAAYEVWAVGIRQGKAAQSSSAVTALGLLESNLYQDLSQIGVDPATGLAIKVRPEEFAYYMAYWANGQDEPVSLYPIHYRVGTSPHGNQILERIESGSAAVIPQVFLRSINFSLTKLGAGDFLKVEGQILEADLADSGGVNSVRGIPVHLMFRCPALTVVTDPRLRRANDLVPVGPFPW